jgi:hypothetical protein
MPQYIYFLKTSIGTLWIRPERTHGWSLSIESHGDTELLGSYSSEIAAADDVFTQHTGWDQWDEPRRMNIPTDLGEWEKRAISRT